MANPFSYAGKRVVVTGGYSGVGAALVELLAELGAQHITVLDLKEPSGPAQAFIRTDMSDPAAVDAAAAAIEGPVHCLFNNAGVAATLPARVVMSVNLLGMRRLTDRLLDKIPAGGTVTNTASIAGGQWAERLGTILELLAIDDWDKALEWIDSHEEATSRPYEFSKECVQVHTMRASKAATARGVRINSVCPGIIETPLLPDFRATMSDALIDWTVAQGSGRLATPLDIAMVLAFLGSDASAFLNGTNLVADGGFFAALTTGQVDFSTLPS